MRGLVGWDRLGLVAQLPECVGAGCENATGSVSDMGCNEADRLHVGFCGRVSGWVSGEEYLAG
jgi:hypothetical protein